MATDTRSTLTINLFGVFEARIDGEPLPGLHERNGERILAYLSLNHGRRFLNLDVAKRFFETSYQLYDETENENHLLDSLRKSLSNLRGALGEHGYRLNCPRGTVSLDLSGAVVDIVAFDEAIRRKDIESLSQAIDLYTAPLLESWEETWIEEEWNKRKEMYLKALRQLATHCIDGEDYVAAVRYLRPYLHARWTEETAWCDLMVALKKSGQRIAAIMLYSDCRKIFQQYGLKPPTAMTDMYHELRKKPSHGFPSPRTSLVGREKQVDEISQTLRNSCLVTLTGAGGVGKTRLAIASAKVADKCSDGTYFADLAVIADPSQLIETIALLLGLHEETDRSITEALLSHLQPKDLLLVLDNCEHLMEACAQLVDTLLNDCPKLRILATSRERLGVAGEKVWKVPSLTTPNPERLPNDVKTLITVLAEFESVQLFVERAKEINQDFQLIDTNGRWIAQICHRLDGIPLAIELAAARVHTLSVKQIAERLDFRLLTGGCRTAPSRQQTLQATLDWSYDLLTEAERHLFRRLSVFAGGFSLTAAEQVCSGEDIVAGQILDVLTALLDKSLVVFEKCMDGEGRYRLLETIRQYSQERLIKSGDEERLRGRHQDFFLKLAEVAERELEGPEQAMWLNRLETEHDNLQAALRWSVVSEVNREAGLRLAVALVLFWMVHGHFDECYWWLSKLLEKCPNAPAMLRAIALNRLGLIANEQGKHKEARKLYEETLEILQTLGDKAKVAGLLDNLGVLERREGHYATARDRHEEGLAIRRELGKTEDMRADISISLNNLAIVYHELMDYEAARACYTESLAISQELGNKLVIAVAHHNLGDGARELGDIEAARTHLTESLKLLRELKDLWVIPSSLVVWAGLAMVERQPERAAKLFGAAEALLGKTHTSLSRDEDVERNRIIDDARTALGEEAFEAAYNAGHAMTWEQAVEYALTGKVG